MSNCGFIGEPLLNSRWEDDGAIPASVITVAFLQSGKPPLAWCNWCNAIAIALYISLLLWWMRAREYIYTYSMLSFPVQLDFLLSVISVKNGCAGLDASGLRCSRLQLWLKLHLRIMRTAWRLVWRPGKCGCWYIMQSPSFPDLTNCFK